MTHPEIVAKFNRVCTFRHVTNAQRDRSQEQWLNLPAVQDIAEPLRTLANFGQPSPL
jgi:hypothetical protein